jgi:hypothetical protein
LRLSRLRAHRRCHRQVKMIFHFCYFFFNLGLIFFFVKYFFNNVVVVHFFSLLFVMHHRIFQSVFSSSLSMTAGHFWKKNKFFFLSCWNSRRRRRYCCCSPNQLRGNCSFRHWNFSLLLRFYIFVVVVVISPLKITGLDNLRYWVIDSALEL